MKEIILDTNFLLAIFQFKVDVFSELERICDFPYRVFVLDKSIEELKKLKNRNAKVALELIKRKNLKTIHAGEGSVDGLLIKLNKKGYIIGTQDKDLKRKLKNKIVIRQKKYLKFV